MKNFLAVICAITMFCCSKSTTETTTSADSTSFVQPEQPAATDNTTAANPEATTSENADNSDTDDSEGEQGDSSAYNENIPMDFQPAADGEVYGDAPAAEEEEFAAKEAAAEPVIKTAEVVIEQYYAWTQDDETGAYTLRFDGETITGYLFRKPTSTTGQGTPIPIGISGKINESAATFSFDEFILINETDTKVVNSVEGKIENGNLKGTRFGQDKADPSTFEATLTGPKPADLSYKIMYKVIDDVQRLYEITLKGTKRKFTQTTKPDSPIENPMMRVVTMDFNFDGNADFFLLCQEGNNCGANFWIFDTKTGRYNYAAAMREIINPHVDYANKRIVSIENYNGNLLTKDYAFDGKYIKEPR